MARTKQLNIVLRYNHTPFVINDLGEAKTPRFELYNIETKEVVKKATNPIAFDGYMNNFYEKAVEK